MRQNELIEGILVQDENGNDIGKSRLAAAKGMSQVIFICSQSLFTENWQISARIFCRRWHFHVFLWLLLECFCCQLLWRDWKRFHGLSAWLSYMHHSKRWPSVACRLTLESLWTQYWKITIDLTCSIWYNVCFHTLAYRLWCQRLAPFSRSVAPWASKRLNALSRNSTKKW